MNESPRAIGPRRSESVKASVTPDVKRRLQVIADKRGWTMSKTVYLMLKVGLETLEKEDKE